MGGRRNLKIAYPIYKLFRFFFPFKTIKIVTSSGKSMNVRVIKDRIGRAIGLSFNHRIKEDGALFVFPKEGRHFFHTQDMKYTIDIIFINAEGRVVYIAYNQTPTEKNFPRPPICAALPIRYVLEIPGMKTAEYGIVLDQKIKI